MSEYLDNFSLGGLPRAISLDRADRTSRVLAKWFSWSSAVYSLYVYYVLFCVKIRDPSAVPFHNQRSPPRCDVLKRHVDTSSFCCWQYCEIPWWKNPASYRNIANTFDTDLWGGTDPFLLATLFTLVRFYPTWVTCLLRIWLYGNTCKNDKCMKILKFRLKYKILKSLKKNGHVYSYYFA